MGSSLWQLPYLAEGQAQPHVPHNAALDILDAVLGGAAISATVAAAPASPAEGDVYILPAAPTGWGGGAEGDVAVRTGGIWHFATPARGWRLFVADEAAERVHDGAAWRRGAVAGAFGSSAGLVQVEAELSGLSGASVTASGLLPARTLVVAVTSWVTAEVTGASSYDVGRSGATAQFGGSLGTAVGSSNVGLSTYNAFSAEDVIVTANGGNFTGGTLRLGVTAMRPEAPV